MVEFSGKIEAWSYVRQKGFMITEDAKGANMLTGKSTSAWT